MIYLVTNQSISSNDCFEVISVKKSLEILDPLTIVGLDTETEGFNPHLKKLLLLQLGCRDFQVVIDCTTVDIQEYKSYLESNRLFLGWNLKFDVKFLFYHNIIPRNLYDGYLAEKIKWMGYPSGTHRMSLKAAAEYYLGIELDKEVRGEIVWRRILTDRIIKYSAEDVRYLEDIREKQIEILYPRGQKLALELENKTILPTAYFEFCGVKINKNKWNEKIKEDKRVYKEAEGNLNNYIINFYKENKGNGNKVLYKNKTLDFPFTRIVQPTLFEPNIARTECNITWSSAKQVAPLFEWFGFNLIVKDKKTGEMKKSVEAPVIKGQKKVNPELASLYLKYKEAQKVVTTYGDNILDLINPITNRIHTQINQIGTDTYRYSSGGGVDTETIPGRKLSLLNIQNIPADERTRSCFICEEGNKWISLDFSSEESIILANISRDKAMIEIFTTGCGDLHSLVAKMCFLNELKDTRVEDVKKLRPDLRKRAKSPEFTLSYGGTAFTLSSKDNIPMKEAQVIEDNYMKGFPGVKRYQDRQRDLVMKLGYINTCPEVGYRVYVHDFNELKEIEKKFTQNFWATYKQAKETGNNPNLLKEVSSFFKKKSEWGRASVNYPIQSRASAIYKIFIVNLFNWVIDNNLFNIVKFCIPVHDK